MKVRGENGIRNPGIPGRKRCQLGVLFRDPLNPCNPADDQDITLPVMSVIVMIVLLKVD